VLLSSEKQENLIHRRIKKLDVLLNGQLNYVKVLSLAKRALFFQVIFNLTNELILPFFSTLVIFVLCFGNLNSISY